MKKKLKKGLITAEGEVLEALPFNRYRIKMENGDIILGYSCGNMVKHNIKAMKGDILSLELSITDLKRARIKYRRNNKNEGF